METVIKADDQTMESADDTEEYNSTTHITAIPEEVLELIFGRLSPYGDMKNAMLVCKQWYRLLADVIKKLRRRFDQTLRSSQVDWCHISSEQGPGITDRYSHSACYFQQSMYVFGGCSATSTTFNDLWRFDLATRQWVRPLAMGTYPSPKACASMLPYRDSLVLYGGWSRPTPLPLHQAPRYFSELHTYTPATNRWSQIMAVSNEALHRVAGHSASILGHCMVVFGGSHEPGSGSNDVRMFDFEQSVWKKPVIMGKKPNPRYGQSQTTLDSEHILIVGGCGGPNQLFSDAWLLRLKGDEGSWEEIVVENPEFSPFALWCHPACMVDGMAVFISKSSRVKGPNPDPQNVQPQHNRVWMPPQGLPAPPQNPAPNGGPPHAPHIPPPPPFPPMAAFQRRRDDWNGGEVGVMGIGVRRGPEDMVQPHNFHGAHNPNIQDVQRLNQRAGQPSGGRAGPRRNPPPPPHSLNLPHQPGLQGSSTSEAGLARLDAHRTAASDTNARPDPQASLADDDGPSSSGFGGGANDAHSPGLDPQEHGANAPSLSREGVHSGCCQRGGGGGGSEDQPGPSYGHRSNGCGSSCHRPRPSSLLSPSLDSDSDSDMGMDVEGEGGGAHAPRPGCPSIRPNAMHNRQRQLDMLRKHENRLWRSRNASNNQPRAGGHPWDGVARNPMVLHVLDLRDVLTSRSASWLPTRDAPIPGAPEERIFHSVVEGRGELVMFGGIQHDHNPMQRVNSPPDTGTHYVSSGLFIISPSSASQAL